MCDCVQWRCERAERDYGDALRELEHTSARSSEEADALYTQVTHKHTHSHTRAVLGVMNVRTPFGGGFCVSVPHMPFVPLLVWVANCVGQRVACTLWLLGGLLSIVFMFECVCASIVYACARVPVCLRDCVCVCVCAPAPFSWRMRFAV